MVTHPFHPLRGRSVPVLYEMHTRRGLWFVCEVDGRWRVSVRQEWTDRGPEPAEERVSVEGLTVVRALIDSMLGQRGDIAGDGE